SVGVLGIDYPGYFDAGDTEGLAHLLQRAEQDPEFLPSLRAWCKPLESLVQPQRERESWALLLDEIGAERAAARQPRRKPTVIHEDRFVLVDYNAGPGRDEFAREVRVGLTARAKQLSSMFLYDPQGSRLFERICRLPEYYLMRAERKILLERVGEIAALFP